MGSRRKRMQSHRKRKPGPSQKHATYVESEDEYDEVPITTSRLPKFNFDSSFDYGDAWHSAPPKNRHFVPRYSKLRKAGGKSISFYEKWRKMQYDMNCVMKRYMELVNVNLSVLPPCTNYDLWRRPSWRKNYDRPLDEDPCPDCDVRFRFENNEWHAKVAPASILSASRWSKCRFKNSVVMIGLPQHIAIGYLRISNDCAMFEFFDPAGPTGDREGVKELKKWAEKKLPKRINRPVQFHQVHRRVNFQHDIDDVMCQTWIWYWVYFRVVRNYPPREIAEHVIDLINAEQSLKHIHQFNCFLSDLYKVGFLMRETQSQTDIADAETPRGPSTSSRSNGRETGRDHQIHLLEIMNNRSNKEVQLVVQDHRHINLHALYPLIMDLHIVRRQKKTARRQHRRQGGVICEESHLDLLLKKKLYAEQIYLINK